MHTHRSVQDELTRESRADAVTVAASYGFMLLYIAAGEAGSPGFGGVWGGVGGGGGPSSLYGGARAS